LANSWSTWSNFDDWNGKANANPKPPSPEVLRKAREIVENSGANSEERFNRVVLGETNVYYS